MFGYQYSEILRSLMCVYLCGGSYRAAGENIAYGQRSAEQVMEGWMNSSGHRANILNAQYTAIGVGVYRSASGTLHWVQLFIG